MKKSNFIDKIIKVGKFAARVIDSVIVEQIRNEYTNRHII